MSKILLNSKEYEILDAKETITIPDCFVKDSNKIGRGHGEAKLYVGQTTDNTTLDFFDNFHSNVKCVMKKEDLKTYLNDCEDEYLHPDQEYRNKDKMPEIFNTHRMKIDQLENEYLYFEIYRYKL